MMNGMTSMIRTDMTTSILEKDCTRTRIKVGNCVLFSSQQFKYKINLVFDFKKSFQCFLIAGWIMLCTKEKGLNRCHGINRCIVSGGGGGVLYLI